MQSNVLHDKLIVLISTTVNKSVHQIVVKVKVKMLKCFMAWL